MATLTAFPISTESNSGWTTQAGSASTLHATIDESVASDADFVQSSADPVGDVVVFKLDTLVGTDFVSEEEITYRYRQDIASTDLIRLTIDILQGPDFDLVATYIHEDDIAASPGTWLSRTRALTAEQRGAITDRSDLYVRLSAEYFGTSDGVRVQVSWVQMTADDSPTQPVTTLTLTEEQSAIYGEWSDPISATTEATSSFAEVVIPETADFTDQGVVIAAAPGEWDARFSAGTGGSIIKIGSTYYFYYVGADGDRFGDDGPAHRCIGVATSSDGLTWTRHASNPVIPWDDLKFSTPDDDEEGAWRIAAMLDDDGTVLLFVSNEEPSATLSGVQIDIWLWTSSDGVSFTNVGRIVEHPSGAGNGSEDELGILGVAKAADGTYHINYIAQVPDHAKWSFAASSASDPELLEYEENILLESVEVGRGSNPIRISETEWALFPGVFDPAATQSTDIRVYRTSAPNVLGTLETTWTGLSESNFAVYLDRDTDTWLLMATTGGYVAGPGGQGMDAYDELRLFTAPVEYV